MENNFENSKKKAKDKYKNIFRNVNLFIFDDDDNNISNNTVDDIISKDSDSYTKRLQKIKKHKQQNINKQNLEFKQRFNTHRKNAEGLKKHMIVIKMFLLMAIHFTFQVLNMLIL